MPLLTLEEIVKERRSQPNQLIEVLHDVQENHGYLSEEAIQSISRWLGVPLIEVFSVASFYKAFRLKPAGKHTLTICMGTACHVRGARLLLDQAANQLGIDRWPWFAPQHIELGFKHMNGQTFAPQPWLRGTIFDEERTILKIVGKKVGKGVAKHLKKESRGK